MTCHTARWTKPFVAWYSVPDPASIVAIYNSHISFPNIFIPALQIILTAAQIATLQSQRHLPDRNKPIHHEKWLECIL